MTEDEWFDERAFARLRGTVKAEVFSRLLELFLENTTARVEEVGRVDPQTEADRIALALHSLKGSALMVGARELEAAAEELRVAVRSGEKDRVPGRQERLRAALERVQARIQRELEAADA